MEAIYLLIFVPKDLKRNLDIYSNNFDFLGFPGFPEGQSVIYFLLFFQKYSKNLFLAPVPLEAIPGTLVLFIIISFFLDLFIIYLLNIFNYFFYLGKKSFKDKLIKLNN